MQEAAHQHVAGSLKQHNKAFKARFASKGELKKKNKGKVERVSVKRGPAGSAAACKAERKNTLKQKLQQQRQAAVSEARFASAALGPKLTAVISLADDANAQHVLDQLWSECTHEKVSETGVASPVTCKLPQRQRATFFLPHPSRESLMDAGKVCDVAMFVVTPDPITEEFDTLLSIMQCQGISSALFVMQGLSAVPQKKQKDVKNAKRTELQRRFDDVKLFTLDTAQDAVAIIRQLSVQSTHTPRWRDNVPVVLVDASTAPRTEAEGAVFSGYLKGGKLSPNQLVHFPGVGTYQMSKIVVKADPCPSDHSKLEQQEQHELTPDEQQESLQTENVPNPLDQEQTWPTHEELLMAEETRKKNYLVPKGTSTYQAAWLVDDDELAVAVDAESDGEMDHEKLPQFGFGDQQQQQPEAAADAEPDSDEERADGMGDDKQSIVSTVAASEVGEEDDGDTDGLDEKWRANRNDVDFPDEVDTPENIPAKIRFQKYRGMKSFRTSPWDPKENLPRDYARIFQFKNFRLTRARVLAAAAHPASAADVGNYVEIHVRDFPAAALDNFDGGKTLMFCGLRKHENKMSVLHFTVRRTNNYVLPIKSKEPLEFHVGFRRFIAQPIFSEHSPRSTKHKFARFFQPGAVLCASIYAPIAFPPCPLIAFKEVDNVKTVCATGGLMTVDPDRLIIKRVVLTGFPFKVSKRKATVRAMFWNPVDVKYWKSIELWTKHKLRGHIIEPLGTHGHMKCLFDGPLQQNDTVCMSLYKRVFPTYSSRVNREAAPAATASAVLPKEEDTMADE
eukprot:TRINITY_DN18766_c0_g1_i1.p1 TRINITY_DN18766_c0_g1~~TRINITY_DN18766_c0_g1_i1.p1  ORF type:complete len:811 (-),score=219.52 TRINITY_DN18766_c0_g1_i1:30-2399(-)